MAQKGSCHCGRITFEVEGAPGEVLECNCSHCERKGFLLWFVPRDKVTLKTPEGDVSTYTFHKHAIQHKFCPTCGTQPFAFASAPDGTPTAAINVRCLEGIDLAGLKHKPFDGRAL